MSITVLPVRDPALQERYRRPSPVQSHPDPGSSTEGMHSVSVELLRAPAKRTAPAPAPVPSPAPTRAPQPPAAAEPIAAAVPGSPAAVEPAAAAVQIELPNGCIVRVPPGFASADLERVLALASTGEPPSPSK